jgi:NAD(P)-dependent dehydrogenase (short-subunit alcohol dehydrogenase family)
MNKSALVLGAGKGIGAACARELAKCGYTCFLMSPSDRSEKLAEEICGFGLRGSATDPSALARLVDLAMEKSGRIDAVVNNTGSLARKTPATTLATGNGYDPQLEGDLLDVTDAEWHSGLDFYYLNIVRMARLVTRIMQKQHFGTIVNISSLAAIEPRLSYPLASPMRVAALAFAKLYADRYARDGIRMNNVLPGFLENHSFSEAVRLAIPMGRLGRVAEIATTVRFLLSDDAGYISGQNILVDGGINRRM